MPQRKLNPAARPKSSSLDLFVLRQGQIKPNTKLPYVKERVAKDRIELRRQLKGKKDSDKILRKAVITEAREEFQQKKKNDPRFKKVSWLEFLQYKTQVNNRISGGYQSSADAFSVDLFHQKAKILGEEVAKLFQLRAAKKAKRKVSPTRRNTY